MRRKIPQTPIVLPERMENARTPQKTVLTNNRIRFSPQTLINKVCNVLLTRRDCDMDDFSHTMAYSCKPMLNLMRFLPRPLLITNWTNRSSARSLIDLDVGFSSMVFHEPLLDMILNMETAPIPFGSAIAVFFPVSW
jgi:hypothetical protein